MLPLNPLYKVSRTSAWPSPSLSARKIISGSAATITPSRAGTIPRQAGRSSAHTSALSIRPSPSISCKSLTTPIWSFSALRKASGGADMRRTTLSSLSVLFRTSMSYWPSMLYPCSSQTKRRPLASRQTPDGCLTSGSEASISSRIPFGKGTCLALSSGDNDLGAAVGLGIDE